MCARCADASISVSRNWVEAVGLLNAQNYDIYDGTDDTMNCTQQNHFQWTYNSGVFLLGAAVMYNQVRTSRPWVLRYDTP